MYLRNAVSDSQKYMEMSGGNLSCLDVDQLLATYLGSRNQLNIKQPSGTGRLGFDSVLRSSDFEHVAPCLSFFVKHSLG